MDNKVERKAGFGTYLFSLLILIAISVVLCIYIHPVVGVILLIISPFAAFSTVKGLRQETAFSNVKTKIQIPQNALKVRVIDGCNVLIHYEHFVWKEDNKLKLFPTGFPEKMWSSEIDKLSIMSIDISGIEYYSTKGEYYTETKVSGGGGGGISVGGTIAGGIAGAIVGGKATAAAGAVIAGRKKVDEIKSETIIHDNRVTNLFVRHKEKLINFKFAFNDFDTFFQVIPDKSYDFIKNLKLIEVVKGSIEIASGGQKNEMNTVDKIRDLKYLKDEGILSEDEYNQKKKELLAQL